MNVLVWLCVVSEYWSWDACDVLETLSKLPDHQHHPRHVFYWNHIISLTLLLSLPHHWNHWWSNSWGAHPNGGVGRYSSQSQFENVCKPLTRVTSCMSCSMSGIRVSNRSQNFQQTHISMSTKAMSIPWSLFGRNMAMHSVPWWWTSLLRQGEFIVLVLFHDWLICDGSAATNIEIPAGAPVTDLNIDELEEWARHMASTANTSN